MSQSTKQAIVETTLALAKKRPIGKITVRDIVEACGITRNTFYYHFHDIYEVLECAIEVELDTLRCVSEEDPEKALFALIDFCVSYKKVWINLYKSVGRDQLSLYISKLLREALIERLRREAEAMEVNESDFRLLCVFYGEALLGVFFRWLKDGRGNESHEELAAIISRMHVVFDGHVHRSLQNCIDNPVEKIEHQMVADRESAERRNEYERAF